MNLGSVAHISLLLMTHTAFLESADQGQQADKSILGLFLHAHHRGTECHRYHPEKAGTGLGFWRSCRLGTSQLLFCLSERDPGRGQAHEQQPEKSWCLFEKAQILRVPQLLSHKRAHSCSGHRLDPHCLSLFAGSLTSVLQTHHLSFMVDLKPVSETVVH